jgi:hypothetical protein
MCPYCGEEVPQDSSKCWKCGTELSEGAAGKGDAEDLDVPDEDEDEDGTAKASQIVDCPFCGSPVPKKAMRCRECGRTLQKVKVNTTAVALWKWGAWAAVLTVAVSTTTIVLLSSKKRATGEDRIHNLIPASYETLNNRIQPLNKGFNPERRQEVWERDFLKKFVHWSEGEVEEIDGAVVKISHTKGSKTPDVIVTFVSDEEVRGLNLGEKIEYSARLVEFGGKDGKSEYSFTLEDGKLEKKP